MTFLVRFCKKKPQHFRQINNITRFYKTVDPYCVETYFRFGFLKFEKHIDLGITPCFKEEIVIYLTISNIQAKTTILYAKNRRRKRTKLFLFLPFAFFFK